MMEKKAEGRTIYWGSGSPFAWAVLLVAEEKGLPYESKLLSFANNDNHTPEYLQLNPRGKVPLLVDGETIVYESQAILHYLENVYPHPALIPASPKERAVTFTRMAEASYLAGVLSNPQFRSVLNTLQKAEQVSSEDLKAAQLVLKEELDRWEGFLQGREYLIGETFTAADAAVFPFFALLARFGLRLEHHCPTVAQYFHRLKVRASVQKTWPPHWKESEDKTWLHAF